MFVIHVVVIIKLFLGSSINNQGKYILHLTDVLLPDHSNGN